VVDLGAVIIIHVFGGFFGLGLTIIL